MKKKVIRNGFKRLTVGMMSALMIVGSIPSAISAETGVNESINSGTIKTEKVKFSAQMNGFASDNTGYIKTQKVPAAVTVGENGTIEITDANTNSIALGIATENARKEISECYKYSISFDMKTSAASEDGEMYSFDDDSNGLNRRVGRVIYTKDKLTFYNNGNDSTTTVISVPQDEWINIKYVVYPKNSDENNLNRMEWYVDNEMITVGASNSETTMYSANRNFTKFCVIKGKGTIFRNFKLEGITKETDDVSRITERLTKIGSWSSSDTSAKGMVQKTATSVATADTDGIKMLKSGNVIKVKENSLEIYDKYSISFDFKTNITENVSNCLSSIYMLDNNSVQNPNGTNQSVGYMGLFNLFGDRIQISKDGYSSRFETVDITPGEWANFEYIISPGESNGNNFWCYINGELKAEGSIKKEWPGSQTGIINALQVAFKSGIDVNSLCFDNFIIAQISNVEKAIDNNFKAKAVINSSNQAEIIFNREIEVNLPVINSIQIKNADGKVINKSRVSVSDDKKKLVFGITNEEKSEYYTIMIPERLLSGDGYVLTENSISTPHFEVTKNEFEESEMDGTIAFKTAYKNSKEQTVNIIAVIAAYDKTTGVLKQIDTKRYDVLAASEENSVFEPTEFPTIEKEADTIINGFIWEAATYAPKCDITPLQ